MRKFLFLFVFSVCVLEGGVAANYDETKLGDDCDSDDCSDIPNAICGDHDLCECENGYVAASNETACLAVATKVGDPCEVVEQCSKIPSAKCLGGMCVVAQAVDTPSTTSKPKEECTKDSECSSFLTKRVCKNGTCVVDLPPVAPKAVGLDVFVLNQACANDSECSADGAACMDKACKCKEGFVPSLNLKACLQRAKSVGEKCVENSQCLLLNGSICENGKCSEKVTKFPSNFSDKLPQLLIGSSCQSHSECKHLNHAECRENVCQCTEGFITSVSSNACLQKAKKEGDPCQIDKQCEDIEEATCLQEECVKPGLVGTKLGKKNGGSRSRESLASLTLAAIFLIKMFPV